MSRLRNYENCELVKHGIKIGIGEPQQINGMCEGYTNGDGNESLIKCQMCYLLYDESEDEDL